MGGWSSEDSQSTQRSTSSMYSGLQGTKYAGQAGDQVYNQGLNLNSLTNRVTGTNPQDYYNFGRAMRPGGQYGMGEGMDAAMQQYGRDMFSRTSGGMAQRGFVSPESQQAVIGSAIRNSLPALAPQIQQFQEQQFMAPQSLFGAAHANADYWAKVLGTQQQSKSRGQSTTDKGSVGVIMPG